jgi:cyclomaltodextrinase
MKTLFILLTLILSNLPIYAQVSWWTPADPQTGDPVTIYYDAIEGTLPDGSTEVTLHWGVNETSHGTWNTPPLETWPPGSVQAGVAIQTPMNNLGGGMFSLTIDPTTVITTLHYVTTDGSNWDNNNQQNWDIIFGTIPVADNTHIIFSFDQRSIFASFTGEISSVNLAGTFNGWSMTETPLTRIDAYDNYWDELIIPTGVLEYKFVINGSSWHIDPDNPNNIGSYNNSLMTVIGDTLPQVYDIDPPENSVFTSGSSIVVSLHFRSGDFGTPLNGSPTAEVDGIPWSASWNSGSSLLTLNPLPTSAGVRQIAITATDLSGRSSTTHLAYGFGEDSYVAVDPQFDSQYDDPNGDFDLLSLSITERADGDSIHFAASLQNLNLESTQLLLTVCENTIGAGDVQGLDLEMRVAGLQSGGLAMLILDPSSSHFNSAIHNRILPHGDITQAGSPIAAFFDAVANTITVTAAMSDLESILDYYYPSSKWHFACVTMQAAAPAEGYCHEITAADGGSNAIDDPDVYDFIFMTSNSLQHKMLNNYRSDRRATLDADGRGIASIAASEIGTNMAYGGPVLMILTQGATTTDSTRTIIGRIQSPTALQEIWLDQNGAAIPVTLNADTFGVSVILEEGVNSFSIWTVDINNDTSQSTSMEYTLLIPQEPVISIVASVIGTIATLDASGTIDPQGNPLSFLWTPDPENPALVALNSPFSNITSFSLPATPGEYYFNLEVTDNVNHNSNGRTFIRVLPNGDGVPFTTNETADWVQNAIIYEIFVRAYSPLQNLDAITTDIDRIAALGVNTIWLTPIFDSPTTHGYQIDDYFAIEPDFGNDDDLHELVAACHDHGMYLILDMVINHTGIGHPFMQDALSYGYYSHYWDWYDRDGSGNYTYYYDWTTLPNINLDNPEAAQYFIDVCKYWIEEFDIDGYRCDVAWGVQERTPDFWIDCIHQLKLIKPEIMMLAEASIGNYILNDRFDLAYDWSLLFDGTSGFIEAVPGPPDFNQLTNLITNYGNGWPSNKLPFRFMENHDETRYINRKTPQQTRLISSLLMSLPGIPMLYVGQEVGEETQRGFVNWSSDPYDMNTHYSSITNGRRLLPSLRTGNWTLLPNSRSSDCYSYARTLDGEFPVVFLGNFSENTQNVDVTLNSTLLNIHPDSTYTVTELIEETYFSSLGADLTDLSVNLPAYTSRLWVVGDSVFVANPVLFPVDDLSLTFIGQIGNQLHFRLDWTEAPLAGSYQIYRADSSDGPFTDLVGTTAAAYFEFSIDRLLENEAYSFFIVTYQR